MKSFKDNQGREWRIAVNVAAIKRVRDVAGVDLLQVLDGSSPSGAVSAGGAGKSLIERFVADPVLLVNVLYAVCQPQCKEMGVTDEQFGEAMAGDAIEQACTGLLDEIVSFCPSPRDRAILGRVLEATRAGMNRWRDEVERKVTSGALERIVNKEIDDLRRTLGEPSGNAPGSSASTPDP